MKRFITAMLTLTLFTGLSSGNVSAEDDVNFGLAGDDEMWVSADALNPNTMLNKVDGLIAIIALAATEVGIVDPDNCPTIVDPDDCPRIMDRVYNGLDDFTAWFQPTTVLTAAPYEDPAIGTRPEVLSRPEYASGVLQSSGS